MRRRSCGRRGGGEGAEDDQDGDTAGVKGYSSSDESRQDGGEAAMRLSAAMPPPPRQEEEEDEQGRAAAADEMRHQRTARGGRAGQLLSSSQQQQQRPSPCQSALSPGRRPAQRRRKRDERPDARKWCEMRGDSHSPPVDAAPSCLGRGCWVASAAIVRIEDYTRLRRRKEGRNERGRSGGATSLQHPCNTPCNTLPPLPSQLQDWTSQLLPPAPPSLYEVCAPAVAPRT